MEAFIKILGAYEILINLIPGVIFYKFSPYSIQNLLRDNNVIILLFTCYFIGLIINRISSIFLEPLLKKLGVVQYTPYEKFLNAEKKDPDHKIDLLVRVNNLYRVMSAMVIVLLFVKAIYATGSIQFSCPILTFIYQNWLFVFLLILFLFSYRKQTSYVKRRIENLVDK